MDIIYKAVRAGFTSAMYDGSALPFKENTPKIQNKSAKLPTHAASVWRQSLAVWPQVPLPMKAPQTMWRYIPARMPQKKIRIYRLLH